MVEAASPNTKIAVSVTCCRSLVPSTAKRFQKLSTNMCTIRM
jgi:hypothetical protein